MPLNAPKSVKFFRGRFGPFEKWWVKKCVNSKQNIPISILPMPRSNIPLFEGLELHLFVLGQKLSINKRKIKSFFLTQLFLYMDFFLVPARKTLHRKIQEKL